MVPSRRLADGGSRDSIENTWHNKHLQKRRALVIGPLRSTWYGIGGAAMSEATRLADGAPIAWSRRVLLGRDCARLVNSR